LKNHCSPTMANCIKIRSALSAADRLLFSYKESARVWDPQKPKPLYARPNQIRPAQRITRTRGKRTSVPGHRTRIGLTIKHCSVCGEVSGGFACRCRGAQTIEDGRKVFAVQTRPRRRKYYDSLETKTHFWPTRWPIIVTSSCVYTPSVRLWRIF